MPVEPTHPDGPALAMTVEDVCRLALDYQLFGDRSAREQIARSGYRDRWRSMNVELLADMFRGHPDWVNAWIQWSEDKRVSSGWYIVRCDSSTFDVGCHPSVPPVRYADKVEACAVFVRHELAEIADVGPLPE